MKLKIFLLMLLCVTKIHSVAAYNFTCEWNEYTLVKPDTSCNDTVLVEYDILDVLDNLSEMLIKTNILFINDVMPIDYDSTYIPMFSDSVYIERINEINATTTIDLLYNKEVKYFIDVYAVKRKKTTSKVLGLADLYFPLFEETLDKYGLPLELKYLPVVESALNPIAGSKAGAKGLWQFMYGTGKIYGLKQTTLIDDRYDPYKSTDAACRHLKDLYNMYGDWLLALAAYNSGAGNVNKAIARSGGKRNYWLIWAYLPKETRGYVPAFSAVAYIMNYYKEHNIIPTIPAHIAHEIDTVMINDVVSFSQISEVIGTPISTLEYLNPAYKNNIIPATKKQQYALRLPNKDLYLFVNKEQEIYNYKTYSGISREKLQDEIKKATESSVHIVRQGETLSLIAKKHHTTINKIKSWNKLSSDRLKIGQKLIVYPG